MLRSLLRKQPANDSGSAVAGEHRVGGRFEHAPFFAGENFGDSL
jgi:hypothetical protein